MHDISQYSDHCAIEFSLKPQEKEVQSNTPDEQKSLHKTDDRDVKYKLINTKNPAENSDELLLNLVSDDTFSSLCYNVDKKMKEGVIEPTKALDSLEKILHDISEGSMLKVKIQNQSKKAQAIQEQSKPWYNNKYRDAKKENDEKGS